MIIKEKNKLKDVEKNLITEYSIKKNIVRNSS